MNKEDIEESPYCEICGHCGYIGCCGISNFIDKHIKGKTNCKNEENIISELEDLCSYQTEIFKDNDNLQSQLDIANKKFEMIKNKIRDMQKRFNQDNYKGVSYDDDLEFDDILSIIDGE